MLARFIVLLLLSAAVLAGCISPAEEVAPAAAAISPAGLLAPDTPMWVDPQNAPHPAYGYPTLSSVPDDAALPLWWQPITARALPEKITGLDPVAQAANVPAGAGIAVFGSIVVVPGFGQPSTLVDISDPAAPKVLAEMVTDRSQHRGAIIIPYPDGRLVTAMSTGYGFEVWDITEPTTPVNLTQVEAPTGGHKIGVVPGTPIIYNANSKGGGQTGRLDSTGAGQTEIYDLTDPSNPVLVKEFKNGFGCHHIYFWNDPANAKFRTLCAGLEFTQIWDTADPLDPKVIVSVPVHHGVAGTPSLRAGVAAFSHFSILSNDGKTLIVGDEMGGGGAPPGCDVHVKTPVREASGPLGNIWFYDVSDEKNPIVKGWFSPSSVLPDQTSCTAHHGRLVPDPEGRDLLAMAFYGAGVVLVDFSDTMEPKMVDQWNPGTNTWEVWYYNGYLITGDLNRGLDVLTFR